MSTFKRVPAGFAVVLLGLSLILPVESYAKGEERERYLQAVKVAQKWGFKDDMTGRVVIKPQFDDVTSFGFCEGLAGVSLGGKWGFIDQAGKIVIKPQFDFVDTFSEGLAAVNLGGKVIERAKIKLSEGGRWGYINRLGKMVIKLEFDDASAFSEGLATVKQGERCGYINEKGKYVIAPRFQGALSFEEGLAAVKLEGKWGYIDKAGNMVIEPQFDVAWGFHGGPAAVKVGDKWGYVDKTGKIVSEPQFDRVAYFSQGLAAVKIGDQWGYVDRSGRMVIKQQFDVAGPFFGRSAQVKKGGKEYMIDRTGKDIAGWWYLTESKSGIYYYDRRNMSRASKNVIKVWVKEHLTAEGKDEMMQEARKAKYSEARFDDYDLEMQLVEIDCKEKKLRMLSLARYNTEGRVTYSNSLDGGWDYIVPASISEGFYDGLCWQKAK